MLKQARKLVASIAFQTTVIINIFVAAVVDGLLLYKSLESSSLLQALSFISLLYFAVECVLKFVSYNYSVGYFCSGSGTFRLSAVVNRYCSSKRRESRRKRCCCGTVKSSEHHENDEHQVVYTTYITAEGIWNMFDLFVVVLGCMDLVQSGKGADVSFLRSMKVLRVVKMLRFSQGLSAMIIGLGAGVSASAPIVFLMGICIFLFGVVGVVAFRQNDPFHFNSLQHSTATLFFASCMDWLQAMYTQTQGCTGAAAEELYLQLPEGHVAADGVMSGRSWERWVSESEWDVDGWYTRSLQNWTSEQREMSVKVILLSQANTGHIYIYIDSGISCSWPFTVTIRCLTM